jgi:SAM-dependent methyltransferase
VTANFNRQDRDDYLQVNRRAWSWLAAHGCDACMPFGPDQFAQARTRLDWRGWLPWDEFGSVLCLACGGGQQGPLFASLGYQVTVGDACPEQLQRDADVARAFGMHIECVEADMLDLSALHGRSFDLVYQAVSACYVPDVRRLYSEVKATLRPGGIYCVEHWNPVHSQLDPATAWDGGAYRLLYSQYPKQPVPWLPSGTEDQEIDAGVWHYIHPLHDLIGGLCDAGFRIERFAEIGEWDPLAEPGSPGHSARYVSPLIALMASRRDA